MMPLVFFLIIAFQLLPAEAQGLRPLAATADQGANLPAQPIGPNDLLAVSVYGAPELTRTVRVSEEGLIRLPMLRDKIDARGLMPAALEQKIAEALEKNELLVEPVVTVTIAEYHSRPINVVGAVKHPLTFQAVGKVTLLEAITRAEGLSEDAGPEILITRPARPGGTEPPVERIHAKGLIDGGDSSLNVALEGGDEVRVPQAARVFVVGNVKKPGAFRVEDGVGMTVLKALAMAEGLMPYASKEAYIYRRADGAPQEVPIELRKILDRKAPDVPLDSSDIFYVPDNRGRRVTMGALERALGFATATTSGILILSHP